VVGVAVTRVLFARMRVKERAVSQAQPFCSEKKDMPPGIAVRGVRRSENRGRRLYTA
jgi:hypothetical protein